MRLSQSHANERIIDSGIAERQGADEACCKQKIMPCAVRNALAAGSFRYAASSVEEQRRWTESHRLLQDRYGRREIEEY